jgi:hypothetical protein
MKRNSLLLVLVLLVSICRAQNIGINALVVDEKIPEEAARQLETKLQSALTANGYADNGYTDRFVLTAKVDITEKDVVPTTPARISEKMDITLMVGDVVENKIYSSVTLQSSGIGTNENKAFISAFRNIKGNNPKIQQMLDEAKAKILDYYTYHCDEIIRRANTLASTQKYDEAIALLVAVPNVCSDNFVKCQQEAGNIYQKKIDAESTELLEKAKAIWATNASAAGAKEVADIICKINPMCSNYSNVESLRNTVESKLQADAKREWEFKMRKYQDSQNFKIRQHEDNQIFKLSLVNAAKEIGVAWGMNQPKTVFKKVVRNWW